MQILTLLYDKEIIEEDAILRWADEKKDADESDKFFVKKSESFIQVRLVLTLKSYLYDMAFYLQISCLIGVQ